MATTVTQPFVLNAMALTNLNIPNGDQSLPVLPIANPSPPTLSTMTVNGVTQSPGREFLVNLGFTSDLGFPAGNNNDKVTLYSGINAAPGTSDVWAINSVVGMLAGSGKYNALGYELDFNNFNEPRGNTGNLAIDFAPATTIALGLGITGASQFPSTSAIFVGSQSLQTTQWSRGITQLGNFAITAYQDNSTCPVGIQFDGTHNIAAINMTSVYGNQGEIAQTALLMKNSQFISWQTADTTNAVSDVVDNANNRIVGTGAAAIFVGAQVIPLGPNFSLGATFAPWGTIFSTVGVVNPSDLKMKINVTSMPEAIPLLQKVTPITFQYESEADSAKTHYGFDAGEIATHFADDFAGIHEEDGIKWLAKDQLIAVLWQANREMLKRIETLEAKLP